MSHDPPENTFDHIGKRRARDVVDTERPHGLVLGRGWEQAFRLVEGVESIPEFLWKKLPERKLLGTPVRFEPPARFFVPFLALLSPPIDRGPSAGENAFTWFMTPGVAGRVGGHPLDAIIR